MLTDLSLREWASLLAALILFLGPGFGLLSFYAGRERFDKTRTIAISVCLSIAFWSVLLAWLQAFRVALTPAAVSIILGAGWLLGLFRAQPWRWPIRAVWKEGISGDISRLALWASLGLTVAVGLWTLRHYVAGLGSDSYHHTLIAQMIADRGMLPDNYLPYAPIVTFKYHFGFHGLVAVLIWLTGLQSLTLTPILGQILMAVGALTVAFFTQATTGSRLAAAVSAAMTGLVTVFPAFFVNWGRDTQLTGLVLLPVFLGLIWEWAEADMNWSAVPFIGLLAAGLALTHYRIVLMAASGVLVLIGWIGISRQINGSAWRALGGRLLLAAAVAGLLVAPWVWHILNAQLRGYGVELGPLKPSAFSLERLGPNALNYPTNNFVIALVLLGSIGGWWKRERLVMALCAWASVMLLTSRLSLAGFSVDTVSVFTSLYFPAAVIIGWMAVRLSNLLGPRAWYLRWGLWAGLIGLALRGAVALAQITEPMAAYVGPNDLPAMAWIQAHTPPSARFMVNTFHWDFQPNFIVGSDAGYWIPLLAGRDTVTAPMTYSVEGMASPDFAGQLVALDRLGGHLTSPEALAMLEKEGVTYVYVGQRGGPIAVEELLHSPAFVLDYQNGPTYVFRLLGLPSSR